MDVQDAGFNCVGFLLIVFLWLRDPKVFRYIVCEVFQHLVQPPAVHVHVHVVVVVVIVIIVVVVIVIVVIVVDVNICINQHHTIDY